MAPIPNVHSNKEIPNFQGIVMSGLPLIRSGIRIIFVEIRLGINRFESFLISFKIFAGTYLRADDNIENNQMYCYSFNKKTSKNHFEGSPRASYVNADHADDLM